MVRVKRSLRLLQRRERAAALTLILFPVLVAGGFLTPGWVRLVAEAGVAETEQRDPVRDRVGVYGHRPLYRWQDLSASSSSELFGFESLFAVADYQSRGGIGQQSLVPALDSGYGEGIAANGLVQSPLIVIFEDYLAARDKAEKAWAKDGLMELLGLCGALHGANCVTDDDLSSPRWVVRAVPEPNTAILVALGLLALSASARRSG